FSPDGKTLAVTTGGAIRLFDVTSGREVSPPLLNDSIPLSLALSPDGRTAIAAGQSAPVLWDVATGRLRQRLTADKESVRVMGFAVLGDSLYSWTDDGILRVWDLGTGRELRRLPTTGLEKQLPHTVVVSPDGKTLAVQQPDQVVLRDAAGGREIQR